MDHGLRDHFFVICSELWRDQDWSHEEGDVQAMVGVAGVPRDP